MKKRVFSLLMVFILMFALAGCGKSVAEEPQDINIASLKGPTSIGLVKLYDDMDNKKTLNNYKYKIVSTPDEIVAGLSKGEIDVAAIPSNLAAVLYNKTEGKLLQVADINTLGVLNFASKSDNIKDIKGIKGKTVILSGKGATPEVLTRYLLKENGINPDTDVNLVFKSEHAEVVSDLAKGDENTVAVLPEPFLTVASKKVPLKSVISFDSLWEKINPNKNVVTGVLVVRKEFLQDEKHKKAFEKFLEDYKASVEYVNKNVDDAAKLVAKYDILPENIAKEAIPKCNIVFIDGKEMKENLNAYYEVLFKEDAKTVGGHMPDEGIYYEK